MNKSPLLDVLSSTQERIESNPTSERLFRAVDMPLHENIRDLCQHTDYVARFATAWFSYPTKKNKAGVKNQEQIYRAIYSAVMKKDASLLLKLRMNREALSFPVTNAVAEFEILLAGMHDSNDASTIPVPFHILLEVMDRHDHFMAMREAIVEKYHRLIVREAHRYSMAPSYLEDIAMELYGSLLKAFGRFDITSGTFTSYVLSWARNAYASKLPEIELGTAFQIPNSVRIKVARGQSSIVNYAVPMNMEYGEDGSLNQEGDDPEPESDNSDGGPDALTDVSLHESDSLVREIIKVYDDDGLLRSLGCVEVDMRRILEDLYPDGIPVEGNNGDITTIPIRRKRAAQPTRSGRRGAPRPVPRPRSRRKAPRHGLRTSV